MSKIIEVVKGLQELEKVGRTSLADIRDAETQLCTNFADEYKEYLSEFGAISAHGIELTGIISVEYCNVVSVTKQERKLNKLVPQNMYVIENTFVDGVIIWQDKEGLIYFTKPNSSPKFLANSLVEYIKKRCSTK